MIRGFGSASRSVSSSDSHHLGGGNLPVPFNIPNVLHNLLFEDFGIEFTLKQKDVVEAVTFSLHAVERMQEKYGPKEIEIKRQILQEPRNEKLKQELEELNLHFFEANQHFKELVEVLSEMLTKEQYAKLLAYSGIPV